MENECIWHCALYKADETLYYQDKIGPYQQYCSYIRNWAFPTKNLSP